MAANNESRRDALKIIGAISVTCTFPFAADELYGQTAHSGHGLVQVQAVPSGPRYFNDADFRLVSRIADLIIPATNTPGAIATGVPGYIDYVVGASKEQQQIFTAGVQWLRNAAQQRFKRDFLELNEEEQIAILTPLCEAADRERATHGGERFFASLKNLTADGYFTSRAGLLEALRYNGNTVLAEFPTCTHEH